MPPFQSPRFSLCGVRFRKPRVWRAVPETPGRTLEEIEEAWLKVNS
jgi:hypothetical protein